MLYSTLGKKLLQLTKVAKSCLDKAEDALFGSAEAIIIEINLHLSQNFEHNY